MQSIGIDLGGSKIAAVLMNEQGKVLKEKRIVTPKSKKAIINALRSLIESLKTPQTKGIGMGCPGFVKPDGRLAMIHNVPSLMNVNLKKELRLNMPLVIANDAKCFALAEHAYGAGKFTDTAVFLKSTEEAAKIVKKTALEYMSIGIANLIMVFNPEKVVLGGGLSNLDVYPELNRLVRKRVGNG